MVFDSEGSAFTCDFRGGELAHRNKKREKSDKQVNKTEAFGWRELIQKKKRFGRGRCTATGE